MSRFQQQVESELPLAVILSPEEQEIEDACFEAEVISLEADTVLSVSDRIVELNNTLEGIGGIVSVEDVTAVTVFEYVGKELLDTPSLESTDEDAGFFKRSWEAIKKFLAKIFNWIKTNLKKLGRAILSRLGFAKRGIRKLEADLASGKVESFVIELPSDPSLRVEHLRSLVKSFENTAKLPGKLEGEELEAFKLESEIRERAYKAAFKDIADTMESSPTKDVLDVPKQLETEKMSNGVRITVTREFLQKMVTYVSCLEEVFNSANAELLELNVKVEAQKGSDSHQALEAVKARVRSARLTMQIALDLMKESHATLSKVTKQAEEITKAKS